jgi:hypothetical protein
MLTLWILISTENFPDAGFQAFDAQNGYYIFFVLYLLVTTFYLMPYMLGLTEDSYNELQRERATKEFVHERLCLTRAFLLLDHRGRGAIDKAMWVAIVCRAFGWSQDVAERLFVVIDVDGHCGPTRTRVWR